MRARPIITSVLASVAILTIGWRIGDAAQENATTTETLPTADEATTPTTTAPSTGSATSSTSASTSSTTPSASASSSTTSSGTNGTYTGQAVQTRYGVVQVKITVKNSKVVDVATVQMTYFEGRSQQIDAAAEPILTSEAKQAGSANINTVSGATYTSEGYIQSLQSALTQAGLQ